MKLIDLEAPYKVEVELNGHKCSISVIGKLVDAVPVVRCKDCKYSHHWYLDKRICKLWTETGVVVFNDGFCSYGERKDDE